MPLVANVKLARGTATMPAGAFAAALVGAIGTIACCSYRHVPSYSTSGFAVIAAIVLRKAASGLSAGPAVATTQPNPFASIVKLSPCAPGGGGGGGGGGGLRPVLTYVSVSAGSSSKAFGTQLPRDQQPLEAGWYVTHEHAASASQRALHLSRLSCTGSESSSTPPWPL